VGAAVQDTARRAKVGANLHLGNDTLGSQFQELDAEDASEHRVEEWLGGCDVEHGFDTYG
jgi:hypothetical protein